MKEKSRKFSFSRKLERLEVYLIAADNPVGKPQFRPIFKRKRSNEVLTREQVTAIKRGRKVLRREMKERGIKRWTDFDITAKNLGLYFDRKGPLWPILLWFRSGNTALKILATTAVLTTVMTITQPLIQYVTQYITQYLTQIVTQPITQFLDRDGVTIKLSDKMLKTGFELSETPDFKDPKEVLYSVPAWDIPCISISQLPYNLDDLDNDGNAEYFTYTFYCRYINKYAEQDITGDLSQYATSYDWGLQIHREGTSTTNNQSNRKVSDAIWIMVIQDGKVILCAKGELGSTSPAMLPTEQVFKEKQIAFVDWSMDYLNAGLAKIHPALNVDNIYKLDTIFDAQEEIDAVEAQINAYFDREGVQNLTRLILRTEKWRDHYKVVHSKGDRDYYQVVAEKFVSDKIVVERTLDGVLPWVKGVNEEVHKYTVVIWLEGDDPECTNELMNGFIGLNFQIKGKEEPYMEPIDTSTTPQETPTVE